MHKKSRRRPIACWISRSFAKEGSWVWAVREAHNIIFPSGVWHTSARTCSPHALSPSSDPSFPSSSQLARSTLSHFFHHFPSNFHHIIGEIVKNTRGTIYWCQQRVPTSMISVFNSSLKFQKNQNIHSWSLPFRSMLTFLELQWWSPRSSMIEGARFRS